MTKKKVFLALDVGEARIGLAVGDSSSSFAFGRAYLIRQDLETDIKAIQAKQVQEQADALVIGLPLRTDGKDSPQTQKVRGFARALEAVGCDIIFEDERFTTHIAGQNILKSGRKKTKRQEKGLLDEASAVLILESYLARLRKTSL